MGKEQSREPAGARTLLLLAVPTHVRVLSDLADGPRSLAALRRGPGSPPQTTLRSYLRSLAAARVLEKRCHGGFPGAVDYRLTAAGDDLRGVTEALAVWLATAPDGPTALGSRAAKRAVKALIEAWATGIARALASRTRSLAELDEAIVDLSYPALERRLSSLRRLGLVQAVPGRGRGTLLELSDWLHLGIAPLSAAAGWEHRWSGELARVLDRAGPVEETHRELHLA
jgi:DNA-binding HxlR family transcriptional regulator